MPETTLANQSLRNTGFLKESQMEVSLIQDFANSVLMRFAMRIGCQFSKIYIPFCANLGRRGPLPFWAKQATGKAHHVYEKKH